eukprot:1190823-Prorocentrum_minimum.AAC.3
MIKVSLVLGAAACALRFASAASASARCVACTSASVAAASCGARARSYTYRLSPTLPISFTSWRISEQESEERAEGGGAERRKEPGICPLGSHDWSPCQDPSGSASGRRPVLPPRKSPSRKHICSKGRGRETCGEALLEARNSTTGEFTTLPPNIYGRRKSARGPDEPRQGGALVGQALATRPELVRRRRHVRRQRGGVRVQLALRLVGRGVRPLGGGACPGLELVLAVRRTGEHLLPRRPHLREVRLRGQPCRVHHPCEQA